MYTVEDIVPLVRLSVLEAVAFDEVVTQTRWYLQELLVIGTHPFNISLVITALVKWGVYAIPMSQGAPVDEYQAIRIVSKDFKDFWQSDSNPKYSDPVLRDSRHRIFNFKCSGCDMLMHPKENK
jgi:hypothetical protein